LGNKNFLFFSVLAHTSIRATERYSEVLELGRDFNSLVYFMMMKVILFCIWLKEVLILYQTLLSQAFSKSQLVSKIDLFQF